MNYHLNFRNLLFCTHTIIAGKCSFFLSNGQTYFSSISDFKHKSEDYNFEILRNFDLESEFGPCIGKSSI